jgi:hypothetical protein
MQDADAQHDQTTSMLKASTANLAIPSRLKPGTKQGSPRPDSRPAAAAKTMSVAAVAAQEDCTQAANTQAARKPAPAVPTNKRQRTAANNKKAAAGRKAAAESEPESEASAGDSDADEPDAAAAASAAAEAASFTPDEVTGVSCVTCSMNDDSSPAASWGKAPYQPQLIGPCISLACCQHRCPHATNSPHLPATTLPGSYDSP